MYSVGDSYTITFWGENRTIIGTADGIIKHVEQIYFSKNDILYQELILTVEYMNNNEKKTKEILIRNDHIPNDFPEDDVIRDVPKNIPNDIIGD